MGKGKRLKRLLAYMLTLCMMISCLHMPNMGIVQAAEIDGTTTVYFYNNQGWEKVYAYIWGATENDPLGGWPGTEATVSDIGDGWYEVSVSVNPTYHIIFNDGVGGKGKQFDFEIKDNSAVYAATNGSLSGLYSSAEEAEEAATSSGEDMPKTTVYFYNSDGWTNVYAHSYYNDGAGDVGLTSWPGSAATASDIGDNWYQVDVYRDVANGEPVNVIFNNNAGTQTTSIYISDANYVYINVNGQAFSSKEETEKSVSKTDVYFYNNQGWEEVAVHAWRTIEEDGETSDVSLTAAWPGVVAESVGGLWYKATIPGGAPFNVIFNNNGNGEQTGAVYIENSKKVYVSVEEDGTNLNAYLSQVLAEVSIGVMDNATTMYFLNNKNWSSIGAYIWGDCGEILGSWNDARMNDTVQDAPELGEKWKKIIIPEKGKYNLIVFNRSWRDKYDEVTQEHEEEIVATEKERAELYIEDKSKVYLTGDAELYKTQLQAECAGGLIPEDEQTVVYFYNERDWEFVSGYTFTKEPGTELDKDAPGTTFGAAWPGRDATNVEEELGEGWYKMVIPDIASDTNPIFITINDGANRTEDVMITSVSDNYVIPTGELFTTQEAAIEAAANAVYDDGCESGENEDLVEIEYDAEGANLPYITYEAEDAVVAENAEVLGDDRTYRDAIQSEASGRQAVVLDETGEYVEFELEKAANAMVLRYSIPDSADGVGQDATLSMSVDGADATKLALTSKYSWLYGSYPFNNNVANGKPHRFYDEIRLMFGETLPEGTTIRLEKAADDEAENYVIDFIECEEVGAPLTQPEGSLSVTDESFGAIADDGQDDYAAFVACIATAKEQGKEVWIPAGTFNLVEEKALEVEHVNVRGAGMWYTNLVGAGVSFDFRGTCKFSDFAMTGVSTVRDDGGDLAGFEPGARSTNTTIENIWMEHIKVGVWSANTENLLIQGCRIRNTWADGINLCTLTKNATVRNNNLRNTGDDCIAIWPWLNDCTGNTITHNTVQIPSLANGIAVYGGGNNTVSENHVMDTIGNGGGICVGSEFDIRKPYHDTTTVVGNYLERCGSMQFDENYPIGAIWIWASYKNPMEATFNVTENTIENSSYNGICVEVGNKLSGLNITDTTITGGTDGIYIWGNSQGSGTFDNIKISDVESMLVNNVATNFNMTVGDKGINSGSSEETNVPITEVKLNETKLSLEEGTMATLTATVVPDNATNKTVTWTTSDPAIATVAGGTVTAVAPGKATITAKAGDKTATCEVTVNAKKNETPKNETPKNETVAVTEVKLDATTAVLEIGAIKKLVATVVPDNATTKTVTWSSSDDKIATVATDGTVTAVAPGKATITAKAGDKTATCEVTVKYADLKSVKVTPTSAKIAAGKSVQLKVTANTANAKIASVKWSVNNSKYAKVNSKGKVTTKSKGKGKTVKVTATVTDTNGNVVKKTVNVKIMKNKVTKVKISGKSTISVKYSRKKVQLKTTVKTNGKNANKTLKWTSSNTKYATVNSKGKVTFKAAGKGKTVTITATSTDGTNKKDRVKIKINK